MSDTMRTKPADLGWTASGRTDSGSLDRDRAAMLAAQDHVMDGDGEKFRATVARLEERGWRLASDWRAHYESRIRERAAEIAAAAERFRTSLPEGGTIRSALDQAMAPPRVPSEAEQRRKLDGQIAQIERERAP